MTKHYFSPRWLFLGILLAGLATMVHAQTGAVYYIAPNGNDGNSGSIGTPWKTIQHAANTVTAGATVNVRAGTYNETVTLKNSGTDSQVITFQNYPGESPVVDGTGLTCCSGGVQGLFSLNNISYVTISGFEIRNFTTSKSSQTPAGLWITGSGTGVQILHNNVHNITTSSEKNGNAFGIAVYGTSNTPISNITIDWNQVYNNKTGNSETVNVDGNVVGFTISNNIIHDDDNIGIDAIGFEQVGPSGHDQASNGEISANTVYNITSYGNPAYGNQYAADGIYCDGCTNVIIERNLVHNADLNIEVASEHKSKTSSYVTVRDNLIYQGNSNGISIGGYSKSVGGTDHCVIVNNTLFANDTKNTGSGELQVQWNATNNVFENNIVYAGDQGLMVNNYTSTGATAVVLNYNIYYAADIGNADWIWAGKNYVTFATYQSKSTQDSVSRFANPGFVNTTTTDLHVSSDSPAVNAGNSLMESEAGSLDYAGSSRVQGSGIDIGAYEQ